MSNLSLALLGGFRLQTETGDAEPLRQKRVQALLGYLAMHAGEAQRRDKLAALLWSRSDDEHARQSLRQTIRELRKSPLLADHAGLTVTPDAITMAEDAFEIDVLEFKRLAAEGSVENLDVALALYQGAFLEGFDLNEPVFEEWLTEARRELSEIALAVMLKLVDGYESDGAFDKGLAIARRILSVDRFQETAHRAIMRCLDRLGRRTEAIQHYKACTETLKTELGVDPDENTVALYRTILEGSGDRQAEDSEVGPKSLSLGEDLAPTTKPKLTRRTAFATVAALFLMVAVVGTITVFVPQDSSQEGLQGAADLSDLALPSGPAIAVLPFDNLSGDPEQDYFADGLAEDILTRLAAFRDLKVIGRTASFRYKGEAVDILTIGRELGVDFILEGSVRRDANSIRVSAQLLTTNDGGHVWAETYDRDLSASNIFAIQDEITEQVASALGGASGIITTSEVRRIQGAPTDNLISYECLLIAKQYAVLVTPESHLAARNCLQKVVAKEPTYVEALAWLGQMYLEEIWSGYNPRETGSTSLDAAFEVLIPAVRLDPNHQLALRILAWAYFSDGDDEQFYGMARKAVAANPNDVQTLVELAMWMGYSGRWDESDILLERLRKLEAELPNWHNYIYFNSHYRDKNFTAAAASARATLEIAHWAGPWYLALAYAGMGENTKAMEALSKARKLEPNLSTDVVHGMINALFLDETHIALLIEGHAGLLKIEQSLARSRPVIAVLPFTNMSGDPEQDYFADGITEDIITALSRFRDIGVIARNSTFQYRGESVDVRDVREELGADYIVEGSIRTDAERIRIAAQLLDGASGTHLWAETFEGNQKASDVFEMQDAITERIVGSIASAHGIISIHEQSRSESREAHNLDSYACVLRAHRWYWDASEDTLVRARDCLEATVEKEPAYAEGWAWLGAMHMTAYAMGQSAEPDSLEKALKTARRAVDIDPRNQVGLYVLARTHYYLKEYELFSHWPNRRFPLIPTTHSFWPNSVKRWHGPTAGRLESLGSKRAWH